MAAPAPKEESNKEKLNRLLDMLEDEFRWCAQHPNDVSNNKLEQLKDAVDSLEMITKNIGGQLHKDFAKLKKEFDYLTQHPDKLKLGDFQRFDDMIQKLFRDLK